VGVSPIACKAANARDTISGVSKALATEILDQSASVGAATVPEDDHVAAQVLEQVAQEIAGLCLLDVLLVELKVEVQAPAFGGDRNARDCRDPVTTVVLPTGAQLLATAGVSRKPDSSAKTRWAPSRAAFFLPSASPPE
jgi:hypothetical protein